MAQIVSACVRLTPVYISLPPSSSSSLSLLKLHLSTENIFKYTEYAVANADLTFRLTNSLVSLAIRASRLTKRILIGKRTKNISNIGKI